MAGTLCVLCHPSCFWMGMAICEIANQLTSPEEKGGGAMTKSKLHSVKVCAIAFLGSSLSFGLD